MLPGCRGEAVKEGQEREGATEGVHVLLGYCSFIAGLGLILCVCVCVRE